MRKLQVEYEIHGIRVAHSKSKIEVSSKIERVAAYYLPVAIIHDSKLHKKDAFIDIKSSLTLIKPRRFETLQKDCKFSIYDEKANSSITWGDISVYGWIKLKLKIIW